MSTLESDLKPAKETKQTGMKARNDAVKELIDKHQDEYDNILKRKRKAMGLSETPSSGKSPARLKARKERLLEQLKKIDEQLNGS